MKTTKTLYSRNMPFFNPRYIESIKERCEKSITSIDSNNPEVSNSFNNITFNGNNNNINFNIPDLLTKISLLDENDRLGNHDENLKEIIEKQNNLRKIENDFNTVNKTLDEKYKNEEIKEVVNETEKVKDFPESFKNNVQQLVEKQKQENDIGGRITIFTDLKNWILEIFNFNYYITGFVIICLLGASFYYGIKWLKSEKIELPKENPIKFVPFHFGAGLPMFKIYKNKEESSINSNDNSKLTLKKIFDKNPNYYKYSLGATSTISFLIGKKFK